MLLALPIAIVALTGPLTVCTGARCWRNGAGMLLKQADTSVLSVRTVGCSGVCPRGAVSACEGPDCPGPALTLLATTESVAAASLVNAARSLKRAGHVEMKQPEDVASTNALRAWLFGVLDEQPAVKIALVPGMGRGLIATREVAAGDELLSVPWSLYIPTPRSERTLRIAESHARRASSRDCSETPGGARVPLPAVRACLCSCASASAFLEEIASTGAVGASLADAGKALQQTPEGASCLLALQVLRERARGEDAPLAAYVGALPAASRLQVRRLSISRIRVRPRGAHVAAADGASARCVCMRVQHPLLWPPEYLASLLSSAARPNPRPCARLSTRARVRVRRGWRRSRQRAAT